ncbi:MAG: hypothetical protein JWQ79_3556 [Mucilaginibacter sp.]|jgi:hypothetical protein|nr:hypothetical protein [Mucilaginibacter sp.]
MKKVIFTAVIVFTVGIVSLLNFTTPVKNKIALSTGNGIMLDDRIILATAD